MGIQSKIFGEIIDSYSSVADKFPVIQIILDVLRHTLKCRFFPKYRIVCLAMNMYDKLSQNVTFSVCLNMIEQLSNKLREVNRDGMHN